MATTKGLSLLGLLGGLLEGESAADLATAVQELLEFAKADHRWVVNVQVRHDPRREGDDP